MDKNTQSISPSVNSSEETTPSTTQKPQPPRKRLGLKLHTNIKAGGFLMIVSRQEESEEV
jgi:hypothetical protein